MHTFDYDLWKQIVILTISKIVSIPAHVVGLYILEEEIKYQVNIMVVHKFVVTHLKGSQNQNFWFHVSGGNSVSNLSLFSLTWGRVCIL